MPGRRNGFIRRHGAVALVATVLPAMVFSAPSRAVAQSATPAPAWFRESLDRLTRDGGRWTADNSRYRTDTERFGSYGTEFTKGAAGTTARGRLFGIHPDGREENFWEFYIYWDALAGKGVFTQTHVSGAFGIGELKVVKPGVEELDQTFWWRDGTVVRSLHREQITENEKRSETFDWSNGTWVPRRQYVWKRGRLP